MYRAIAAKCAALMFVLVIGIQGMAAAQDKATPIEMGKWVNGEITSDTYAINYSFSAKEGQLLTIVMMADPDNTGLDTALELRDDAGDLLEQNDDVLDNYAMILYKVPSDSNYTIVATRYQGKDGDSTGKYLIELNQATMLKQGQKMTVKIASDFDKRYPQFYVIQPESNGTVKFEFNVGDGELYPQLGVFKWVHNDYPEVFFSGYSMDNINNLSFGAQMDSKDYYVLMVDPVPVFYGQDITATLAFSIA